MHYKIVCLCLLYITGTMLKAQVPAPTTTTGDANYNMNWITVKSFDQNGHVIDEGKQFFDNSGRLIQSQTKVKYRKDTATAYTHVFASHVLRDAYGRDAATSLSAPIDNSEFIYKPDFIRNSSGTAYDYRNFDRFKPSGAETDKTNNPDPLGNQTVKGTLAWYYSTNNNWEPYTPVTSYPYDRQIFYRDGTGLIKKVAGVGEIFKPGSGHEPANYTYPVINEFAHYATVRNKFFGAELGASFPNLTRAVVSNVMKDENGMEVYGMADKSGKILIEARPGNDATWINSTTLGLDSMFTATIDSDDRLFIGELTSIEVYTGTTLFYSGPANLFFPSMLGTQTAKVKCVTMFSYQACTGAQCSGYLNATIPARMHYFKILANSTPVTISGNYTLYNMDTETTTSLNNNSLNKGYYKVVVNTGEVTLQYRNSYTDISYNFYNQLGQLVATIAPEGVKKLIANINAYATKNDIPFITLYEYDMQGRLVKTRSADVGVCEFVYRTDGRIRFSQNAEQRTTGRFSYTNYDAYGRPVESGVYQPDAGGIAFNVNTGSAMKGILENTTATGGLTTGTKTDVVITVYDQPDSSHGLTGYTQQAAFIQGAISRSMKYSSIVNNTPDQANLVNANWYNYDVEGKEVWKVQYIAGLGYKTTDFYYDVLGRVIKKVFQKNTATETFVHYFEYDAATQKLWKIYTNTTDNAATRLLQATYIYYLHGPLKRVELATNLQGTDYTYTLQGALKAINNSDKTKDPGADGSNGVAADAYGMVLDYYTNDYVNNRSGIQPIKGVNATALISDSYNGNVKAMTWYSQKPASVTVPDSAVTYVYKYDDKYQFTESIWGRGINFANSPATFTTTTFNKETVKHPTNGTPAYDAHGNIQYLQRTNTSGTLVDKFAYTYYNNTNKLQSVVNAASGTPQTYATYTYDSLGRVTLENTADAAKRKYIQYDASGKVKLVARDPGFTQKVVEYVYDASGQRIVKKTWNASFQLSQVTYYTGDAIYTQPVTNGTTYGAITAQEYPIEGGNGRLGIYYRPSNLYAYQLADHLGNVRAVVARNGSNSEVRMYSDYYPYGMVIQQGGTNDYRYGYQGQSAEKDNETDWNAFELRMYDSRIARWMAIDLAGQHISPYLAMGNNPVSSIDKDGAVDSHFFDWYYNEQEGLVYMEGVTGEQEGYTWVASDEATLSEVQTAIDALVPGNSFDVINNWQHYYKDLSTINDIINTGGDFTEMGAGLLQLGIDDYLGVQKVGLRFNTSLGLYKGMGGFIKLSSAAGYVTAITSLYFDYNAATLPEHDPNRISWYRFGWRTTGNFAALGVGIYLGAAYGSSLGPWGTVIGGGVGAGFWAAEQSYDGVVWYGKELSKGAVNFQNNGAAWFYSMY